MMQRQLARPQEETEADRLAGIFCQRPNQHANSLRHDFEKRPGRQHAVFGENMARIDI